MTDAVRREELVAKKLGSSDDRRLSIKLLPPKSDGEKHCSGKTPTADNPTENECFSEVQCLGENEECSFQGVHDHAELRLVRVL